jgi:uncharacterized protein YaeQ
VALSATIYNFQIELADADREVYESLELRAARHPSESEEYFVTRVLAYALEYREGIAFSRGISEPEEPAITVPGSDLARSRPGLKWALLMPRACTRPPRPRRAWSSTRIRIRSNCCATLAGEKIHRAESIELYAVDRGLVRDLAAKLERRMAVCRCRWPGRQCICRSARRR